MTWKAVCEKALSIGQVYNNIIRHSSAMKSISCDNKGVVSEKLNMWHVEVQISFLEYIENKEQLLSVLYSCILRHLAEINRLFKIK